MSQPFLVSHLLVAAVSLALAACGVQAGNEANQTTVAAAATATQTTIQEVRIGHQASGSLVFLKDQKTLDEALAKENIKVNWVKFTSGPPMLEALNTGNLDFATTGEAPPIFAQAANAGLVYVAHEAASPDSEGLLLPKGSNITDVSQLKGKKIAVVKGSSAHYTLLQGLKKHGLKFSDITPVYLQPSDGRAAFEQGSVDAWVVWEPYRAAAEKQLGATTLFNTSGLKPSYSFYLARKEFAEQHPALVKTIVKHIDQADQTINADLKAFGNITAKQVGVPEDIAYEAVIRRKYGAAFITPEIAIEQQKVADAFYAEKLIPKAIQVNEIMWQAPQN
ncbi:aliphatic sulfonate ABC transporter substrate-binding protein [Vitreoscilla stercoraria]|uniref:Aliphatic sulfonate ABC transporter substrate-binding protein n=1 Tax=Vitreoscilla stercoraria TaxID=61 RepID=A0ABY4EDT5_VITST|nr:aliphatic sulfonate ABC transporter substrate-binding protein [Vitreoscilla stercoraria]UOO92838.1 aliphatic sulfonate ABC transporter substrate-binding protein [Vitreoscilla stercoraria]